MIGFFAGRQGRDDGLVEHFFQIPLRQGRGLDVGPSSHSIRKTDGLQLPHGLITITGQFDQHLPIFPPERKRKRELGYQKKKIINRNRNKKEKEDEKEKVSATALIRSASAKDLKRGAKVISSLPPTKIAPFFFFRLKRHLEGG